MGRKDEFAKAIGKEASDLDRITGGKGCCIRGSKCIFGREGANANVTFFNAHFFGGGNTNGEGISTVSGMICHKPFVSVIVANSEPLLGCVVFVFIHDRYVATSGINFQLHGD